MKDLKLKKMIKDVNMLVALHDYLSIYDKKTSFKYSDTFDEIMENHLITGVKYLKSTVLIFLSFGMMIQALIKLNVHIMPFGVKWGIILVLSVIYGVLFVKCKDHFRDLCYQLRFKKACQYVFLNYSYEEYVLFLDKYLSECSTKNYYPIKAIKHK